MNSYAKSHISLSQHQGNLHTHLYKQLLPDNNWEIHFLGPIPTIYTSTVCKKSLFISAEELTLQSLFNK